MAMDKRVVAVLDAIANEPGITGSRLEAQFRLTRKQLSYTLKKVNDYLETQHLDRIGRLKTGRLRISRHVIEHVRQHRQAGPRSRYLFSGEERGPTILFMLLTRSERLSLLHLSSALGVSQNTVISDLKKVRAAARAHRLIVSYNRVNGYHIAGEELDKRHLLLRCLRRVLEMPVAGAAVVRNNRAIGDYLEPVSSLFSEIEKRLKIQFTDIQLQELIYFSCFILQRIAGGKYLQTLPGYYADIAAGRDYAVIHSIVSKTDIDRPQEIIFLTALIRSANIQLLADKYFHLDASLLESVASVVDNFEKISCVTLKEKSALIETIYQHWKPAWYRIRYHLTGTSHIHELVAQEFGHLHEMVRRATLPFAEQLGCAIPEEEVAFLTVLLGGWLTREGVLHEVSLQKVALVVCENGATIAAWLLLTLQALLPELRFTGAISRREFAHYRGHYDVVFSTTHLPTTRIVFVVNPQAGTLHKSAFRHHVISTLQGVDPNIIQVEQLLLIFEQFGNITDHQGLQRALAHYIYQDKAPPAGLLPAGQHAPSLVSLLSGPHLCFCDEPVRGWRQAITRAAASLLEAGVITRGYLAATLARIQDERPWIMLADGVVIAHAGVDEGALDTGMALLRLPEKIDIAGYMQADIIIVLATLNPQKHLKALAQLNTFLEFHQGAEHIRHAETTADLLKIIASHQ